VAITAVDGSSIPFVLSTFTYDELAELPLYWTKPAVTPVARVCILISVPENEQLFPQLLMLPAGEEDMTKAVGYAGVPATLTLKEGIYKSVTGSNFKVLVRCIVPDRQVTDYRLGMLTNQMPVTLFGISAQSSQ
jgi:hypothetical protein